MKLRDIWANRQIWVPDMFVAGDHGALVAATPAETGGRSFVKIESNGDVLASAKISSKVACPVAADATEVECLFAVESFRKGDSFFAWVCKESTLPLEVSIAGQGQGTRRPHFSSVAYGD